MYAYDVDLMRQQAQERQQALLNETHTSRLLQLQQRGRPTLYRQMRNYLGARLVAWGTQLQQPAPVSNESLGM